MIIGYHTQIVVKVMIQNFFKKYYYHFWGVVEGRGGGGGGSLAPPRLNVFTVGNMGVMICLGQEGLHSLSASSWRCDEGTIEHEPLNSNLHVGLHLFVWITYIYVVSWRKKPSYFMQSALVLFCLKKVWSYNSFSGKHKKVPLLLTISIRKEDRDFDLEEPILPPQTTTNTLTLCSCDITAVFGLLRDTLIAQMPTNKESYCVLANRGLEQG